jgi:hypothetical protein
MSFAVVEFDDETVDVIPTNWCISETCCYWAPYRGLRFTSAVRKQEEPQQTWTQCVMRVLHHYGLLVIIFYETGIVTSPVFALLHDKTVEYSVLQLSYYLCAL